MKRYLFILITLICFKGFSQTFTDVTEEAGINIAPSLGDAIVWIDHNKDGWLDFYTSSSGGSHFYENNGDGTFTDITQESGLSDVTPFGLAIGDFNNDEYNDLLVVPINASLPITLYKNNEGNGFYPIFGGGYGSRAVWLDYNIDGNLDIFCNTSNFPFLYMNTGNSDFIDVAEGMDFNSSSGETSSIADYNNDGLPDIYCTSSGLQSNRLYRNEATDNYIDVTFSAQVSDYRKGVAQAWGDYNNDGWMDLYIANIQSNRNVLFKNNADGTFSDVTLEAGVSDEGDARTCAWIDVNNDGFLDLFTTNHVHPNKLYLNNGDDTFTNIAPEAGINGPHDGFSVSWGDYDIDGDLDLLITGHSYTKLFRNEGGNDLNYLTLKLEGFYDNKSAIGARVTLYHNGIQQSREVNGGRGSVSQDALPVHFGLGNDELIDSILIHWPSGMEQRLFEISANQIITVEQTGNVPPAHFRLIEPRPDSAVSGSEVVFKWNSSFDPDGNTSIEYYLHIQGTSNDTMVGPLSDTTLIVQMAEWMEADSVSWFVKASDGLDSRPSWDKWDLDYTYTTGIQKINAKYTMINIQSIYPQPAHNLLNIQLALKATCLMEISFFSYSGTLSLKKTEYLTPSENILYLDVSDLKPGSYLLFIETEFKCISRKIVIL